MHKHQHTTEGGGSALRLVAWIKDLIMGKPDPRIIFNDMPVDHTRNAEKRSRHLRARQSEHLEEQKIAAERSDFAATHYHYVLAEIYRSHADGTSQEISSYILSQIAQRLSDNFEFSCLEWRQFLHAAGHNQLIKYMVPGLFNNDIEQQYRLLQKRKMDARLQALAKIEADKAAIARIHELRRVIREADEHATKYAMAGDTMSFAPWIIKLEAAQAQIHKLKSGLSVPIADSWEENMRTGG